MTVLQRLTHSTAAVVRGKRAFVAVVVPIALPLFLASSRVETPATHAALVNTDAPEIRYRDLTTPTDRLAAHATVLTLEVGDTLDRVLTAGGLTSAESAILSREFAKSIDLRRLRPGHLVRFHHDQQGTIDSVQMKVTGWGEIVALRDGSGFRVTPRVAPTREVEVTVGAQVQSSLYEALRDAGEEPGLAQDLVDVFQWDIDFFALKRGDEFNLVVRKRYAGNDFIGYGPITAARFSHNGTVYEAFRHEEKDGRAGYYARSASPLRKQFLRAPLKFTRITSGFSRRRFHPILNIFRPHYGVDYGAPVGTPVMTTADGVVVESRYKNGEGKFVRIRHSSSVETYYLHLSRFASGIRKGTKVTQGDVIGYVGSTGMSTGPHLDYRVTEGGRWIDPLKLKSITPDPIRGESLVRFRANVARLTPRLTAPTPQFAQLAGKRRALF